MAEAGHELAGTVHETAERIAGYGETGGNVAPCREEPEEQAWEPQRDQRRHGAVVGGRSALLDDFVVEDDQHQGHAGAETALAAARADREGNGEERQDQDADGIDQPLAQFGSDFGARGLGGRIVEPLEKLGQSQFALVLAARTENILRQFAERRIGDRKFADLAARELFRIPGCAAGEGQPVAFLEMERRALPVRVFDQ